VCERSFQEVNAAPRWVVTMCDGFRSNEGQQSGVVPPLSSRNRLSAFRPLQSVALTDTKSWLEPML